MRDPIRTITHDYFRPVCRASAGGMQFATASVPQLQRRWYRQWEINERRLMGETTAMALLRMQREDDIRLGRAPAVLAN